MAPQTCCVTIFLHAYPLQFQIQHCFRAVPHPPPHPKMHSSTEVLDGHSSGTWSRKGCTGGTQGEICLHLHTVKYDLLVPSAVSASMVAQRVETACNAGDPGSILKVSQKTPTRALLVVQWLRIYLEMQGTPVQSLVQEDPTCCGTTKPKGHHYWAHAPQQEKPLQWEARTSSLENSPCHHPLPATTRESPQAATKTQCSQKKSKK